MYLLWMMLLFTINSNSEENLREHNVKDDFEIVQHLTKGYRFIVGISYDHPMALVMFCTGSLIQDTWVLTAGICVAEEREYIVTYTRDIKHGSQQALMRVNVTERVLHPGYSETTNANNIGLMKVEPIKDINAFAQFSKTDYTLRYMLPVVYARYWYDPITTVELHLEKLNISYCSTTKKETESVICVQGPDIEIYKGGQLVYNNITIIGVYSGQAKRFVPISDHFDWIRRETDNNTMRISVALTLDTEDRKL